jgi:hypothetical protein
MSINDIIDTNGPVITGCVFGSVPWYMKLKLPRRLKQWLQRRSAISVHLMWHPETKDHIAVVNGMTLRVPRLDSEYPCFMDLDFSTSKRAYKLYQRVNVDLSEYRTLATYGVCKDGQGRNEA